MSAFSVTQQKIDASDIRLIQVGDLVQDTDGTYLRTVRFYGDPYVANAPTLLLEVMTRSANRADLVVATPAAGF
jgi:hypothetical protein